MSIQLSGKTRSKMQRKAAVSDKTEAVLKSKPKSKAATQPKQPIDRSDEIRISKVVYHAADNPNKEYLLPDIKKGNRAALTEGKEYYFPLWVCMNITKSIINLSGFIGRSWDHLWDVTELYFNMSYVSNLTTKMVCSTKTLFETELDKRLVSFGGANKRSKLQSVLNFMTIDSKMDGNYSDWVNKMLKWGVFELVPLKATKSIKNATHFRISTQLKGFTSAKLTPNEKQFFDCFYDSKGKLFQYKEFDTLKSKTGGAIKIVNGYLDNSGVVWYEEELHGKNDDLNAEDRIYAIPQPFLSFLSIVEDSKLGFEYKQLKTDLEVEEDFFSRYNSFIEAMESAKLKFFTGDRPVKLIQRVSRIS